MADPTVSITDLRIDGQAVVFIVDFTGDPEVVAASDLYIYDATHDLKKYDELGKWPLSQVHQHTGHYEITAKDLPDGDYAAWIKSYLTVDDPATGVPTYPAEETKGVSFLVGRGRVYASSEEAHAEDEGNAVVHLSNLRLNGTWVEFDMENKATHDVSVDHGIMLHKPDGSIQEIEGREIVNASATQAAHHLLPEALPDGSYAVTATASVEGRKALDMADLKFEIHDGAITVVP